MASRGAPGELTRRYAANTLANGGLRVVSALASLWAARELVEALGAAGFGLVTLSGSLVGYLSFLGLGLPAGLVRQVAEYRGRGLDARVRGLVRIAFGLFCGVGAAAALALALFASLGGARVLALSPGTEDLARTVFLATAAVVLFSWPFSAFSATLTGMQKVPVLATVTGVAAAVSAVASVVAARAGAGPAGVVLATGVVVVVSGAVHGLLVRREIQGRPAGAEPARDVRAEIRPLLSFGLWALALELASVLIYQTDQILLGVFVSVESLTAYYVVARLHNLVREGNGVLGAALFPLLAEEHGKGNPAAEEQVFYRGTRYAAAVTVPATLAAMLLAGPFLRIWMGDAYAPLAPLAQAFLSYWLVAALTSTAGQAALGRGDSAVLGKIALATAIVNVAVSLALVRRFGIAGVVAGTLAAYALALPAQVAILFPRLGISRRRFLREVVAPVYGISVPAAAAWWAILRWGVPAPRGVLSLAALGAAIVGSCWAALWFAAVDRRDRERLVAGLRPRRSAP